MKINLSKVLGLSVLALTVSLSGVLTGCTKKSDYNHSGESVVGSSSGSDSGVLNDKETLVDLFNAIDCVNGELRTESGYKIIFEKDGQVGDVSCLKQNN